MTTRAMTYAEPPERFPRLSELPRLEALRHLDGVSGSNRETQHACEISANNDYEAIQCWLAEYAQTTSTHRLYQKEAERFLLWSIFQRQKALSSLGRDDLQAYIDFLSHPHPRNVWCGMKGGRGRKRGDVSWRPFVGPLSDASQSTSVTVLRSLFKFLTAARYLHFNPFTIMRKKRRQQTQHSEEETLKLQARILEPDEWHAILDTLDNWPATTRHQQDDKERRRFLVTLLYFLGLRINELVTHRWNAFRKEEGNWWFYVVGKGGKLGKIPANDALMTAVRHFRRHCRLTEEPSREDNQPIVVSWRTGKALTARYINKLLKQVAREAAKQFVDQPEKAEKLKKFSAHWLRHLSASMQDRAGISFKHVRSNLRHENDETTRRYVHAYDQDRHEDMRKLQLRFESD